MEEDRRRLLHFLRRYKIYIVIMSGPFIITEYGYWEVSVTVRSKWDVSKGISSKKRGLTTPPRSGWEYRDGTRGLSDDTLLFLPGGPGKEM